MSQLRISRLAIALVAAIPMTASAFGFGATNDDYYGPWGPYGGNPPPGLAPPGYQPQSIPPYGPPPGSRDVRGMWGSGPIMQWGNRDDPSRYEKEKLAPYEGLHRPWKWSKPWPSMLGDDAAKAQSETVPATPPPAANQPPPPPAPNYGARGQMYPGWERYQQAAPR